MHFYVLIIVKNGFLAFSWGFFAFLVATSISTSKLVQKERSPGAFTTFPARPTTLTSLFKISYFYYIFLQMDTISALNLRSSVVSILINVETGFLTLFGRLSHSLNITFY